MNGFDSSFPVNYNDVDLCLRSRSAGYEVIFEPSSTLRHDECATRAAGTKLEERELLLATLGRTTRSPGPVLHPVSRGRRDAAGLALKLP